jgi:hypothetical protein
MALAYGRRDYPRVCAYTDGARPRPLVFIKEGIPLHPLHPQPILYRYVKTSDAILHVYDLERIFYTTPTSPIRIVPNVDPKYRDSWRNNTYEALRRKMASDPKEGYKELHDIIEGNTFDRSAFEVQRYNALDRIVRSAIGSSGSKKVDISRQERPVLEPLTWDSLGEHGKPFVEEFNRVFSLTSCNDRLDPGGQYTIILENLKRILLSNRE